MILLVIFVDLYININIYVFERIVKIDICSRISKHAISLRSYSIFYALDMSLMGKKKKVFKKIFL